LVEGRRLILGGVEIPHNLGLLGHSDADVLIHAVMDAIIGALGEGDIGRHFPDTSGEFKDISSMNLLVRVKAMMEKRGADIQNIDSTLIMQKPKVAGYIEKMKANMERFKVAANELSNKKMTVDYDIFEINEPIKTITYSEEYGYYLDSADVQYILKEYLEKEEYDYIFVTTRLGDMEENIEIPVYDWIGLRRYGFTWNRIFKY
jgi:2-C-methyl-D-erythritol 2,4-cyclodiphosphate synthase